MVGGSDLLHVLHHLDGGGLADVGGLFCVGLDVPDGAIGVGDVHLFFILDGLVDGDAKQALIGLPGGHIAKLAPVV